MVFDGIFGPRLCHTVQKFWPFTPMLNLSYFPDGQFRRPGPRLGNRARGAPSSRQFSIEQVMLRNLYTSTLLSYRRDKKTSVHQRGLFCVPVHNAVGPRPLIPPLESCACYGLYKAGVAFHLLYTWLSAQLALVF